MKAMAGVTSRANTPRAAPAAPRSRARARAATHHEQQADRRGSDFVAGRGDLGHGLHRATTADHDVPGSVADRLPTPLQAALESAFAADLSSIRVHHDAAAAHAARSLDANAFASGASIYFGGGAYDPSTERSRRLIAHEVTHVLQQAGRRASRGGWRVDDVHGRGPVQREWASPLTSSEPPGNAAQAVSLHRDELPDDAPERALLQRLLVETEHPATGGTAYWSIRATYVVAGARDPVLGTTPNDAPSAVASAMYDALKVSGLTVAAARLLNDRHDLMTFYFSAETYAQYVDGFGSSDFGVVKQRLYEEWSGGGWFGPGTPRAMLDKTLRFLIAPTATIDLQRAAAGDLVDTANAEMLRRHAGTLGPDELHYVTVLVAAQIEQLRHSMLEGARTDVMAVRGYVASDLAGTKLNVALRLKARCEEAIRNRSSVLSGLAAGTLTLPFARETMHLWLEDTVPALRDVAQYAIDFWGAARAFDASLRSGQSIEGLTTTAAAELAGIDAVLPGYRPRLAEFLHALVDRADDGTLPPPAAFAARRDAAVRVLDPQLTAMIERPLAELLRDAQPSGTTASRSFAFNAAAANRALPPARRGLYAWALTIAHTLRLQAITSYTAAADIAQITRQHGADAAAEATDLRNVFRVRLANAALGIAARVGWTDWVEWMRPISNGLEVDAAGQGIGGDYVAFATDWTLEPDTPVSRMAEDLPSTARGFEPMRTADLVEFYLAQHYDSLTRHVDDLLDTNRATYVLGADPVLDQAFTAVRAEFQPQRYVVRDWEWVTPWTDSGGTHRRAPRTELRELIGNHPLTKALVRDLEAAHAEPISWAVTGAPIDGHFSAVLWAMPSPRELIDRLQTTPAISQVVLDALAGLLAELPQLLADTSDLTPDERTHLRELIDGIAASGTPATAAPAPVATPATSPLAGFTLDRLMTLPTMVWWELWRAILSARSGDRRTELLEQLREALARSGLSADLRAERHAAFEGAQLAERRALAHDRRRVVETQLKPALMAFRAYSFDRYRIPGRGRGTILRQLAQDSANLLEHFVGGLPDQAEREGHLAMAVFELADEIHAKLVGHRELADIVAWVPLIDSALYWAHLPAGGADLALRDTFTVAEEAGNTALFDARGAKLQAVLEHMALVLRERFMEWGVVGVKGDGTIENPGSAHGVGEVRNVGRGTVFTIDGRSWEILQVFETFTFHPGSFALRSMANRQVAGSMLKIGNGPYMAEGERPDTLLMRVMIDEGPVPVDIRANGDTEILTQLTWALHMHATLEQLAELGVAIQTFGELMMDAAELFPGGGQALAAARLMTTAMGLITGELPGMLAELITHPRALLGRVWDRLHNLLSVQNVIGFLIFSNTSFDGLIRDPRAAGPHALGGSTSSRMRRLMAKLQTFGRGVGRVFVRVHDAVQDRRQQVEHTVQNSPRMVRLIQIVADYYLVIASIADHLPGISDLPDAITDFQATAQDLPGRIDEMIAHLGSLELPADILPREQLVDVLLDVIGHRLGGKYKLGVDILMQLLDFIGARQTVVKAIADALGDAGVTTENLFPMWNDTIVPGIRHYLQRIQAELRDSLHDTFGAFGVALPLATPEADVRLTGSDFPGPGAEAGPEAQPMLDEDLNAGFHAQTGGSQLTAGRAGSLLERIAGESGEPLPAAARADAESRLGQDFSHVRIHRDSRAGAATRAVGARALTSGSHVVLGAGAASAASGGPVLYHELAHVAQQTGARPAGSSPIPPRAGRARRGLRWDPRAEAEADAVSAAAMRGGSARASRRGRSGAGGWQPSMLELYGQRFLRQLTDVTAIEAEVADIDTTGASTGLRLIGTDVRHAVAHVAANLRLMFHPGPHALSTAATGPFHSELDVISTHLLANHADVAAAIEDIAIRASFEAARAHGTEPARMALNIADFSRRLERYIFGKTGILIDLEFEKIGRGRSATFRNPNAPYNRAVVKMVFLANVHGNSRLWTDALAHRTTVGGAQGAAITPTERAELRTQIRPVLRDLGPSSSIWDGNAYRFSHAIFAAADELKRIEQDAASGGTLPAASLPPADHYLNTTGSDATPGFGNQRLHLGTFGQKASGEQSGKERESHHITQYLLVEYFHNGMSGAPETDQDRMGFPLLTAAHPDAYGAEMHASTAGVPQRFGAIKIDELEQGRGGKMPTILIARGTHRRGNLHVNPHADDFDSVPVGTQAGAVNHIYKRALPEAQRRIERDVAAGTQPYSAWEAYKRQHDVGPPIASAMQTTYEYMRNLMQTQLRTGLAGIERGYYNDLYAAAHAGSTTEPMSLAHMNAIADKAITHNRHGDATRGIAGLESYGWRG